MSIELGLYGLGALKTFTFRLQFGVILHRPDLGTMKIRVIVCARAGLMKIVEIDCMA